MMLREFREMDFSALLNLINKADKVDGAGLGMDEEMLRYQLAHGPAGAWVVADSGGEIVGYCRLEFRPGDNKNEVLAFGIVAPEHRGTGIGKKLLDWARIKALETYPYRALDLRLPVRHSVRGLRELAEALGFVPAHFFYVLRYKNPEQLPTSLPWPDGLVIRHYEGEQDVNAYVALLRRCFSNSFNYGEVLSVTREPGFDPTLWLFAEQDGKMVGFCTGEIKEGQAEVSFLGVESSCRGKGIGRVLLRELVSVLVKRRQSLITLAVNTTNSNAIQIYRDMGFEEWRQSTTYCLKLRA